MRGISVVEIKDLKAASAAIAAIGAETVGVELMASKAVHRVLKLNAILPRAANILKQEMLSLGGEAAVSRVVLALAGEQETDVLLMGTLKQYRRLTAKLERQYFGLPQIAAAINTVLTAYEPETGQILDCRGKKLVLGRRTLVMGILNLTPDSFSDGGSYPTTAAALDRAHQMVAEGADLIDVGAESTRPGSTPVSVAAELARLLPVLDRLVKEIAVPVSVDTSKAEVAREALACGAHLINDVWGFKADPRLPEVVAAYEAPVVLMHNQQGTNYQDLMSDILYSCQQSIALGTKSGILSERILIDPGIGFGKDTRQNLEVLRRLAELKSLGKPILLGTSRKSFIGNTLDLPVTDRLEGTAATVAAGILHGADIIRVHDVQAMVRVARMTDAIVRTRAEDVDYA